MTPELIKACEVVFQEHRASVEPIVWTKDIFQGRMSWGLREMAKETLIQKKVIYFPNKAKKITTQLNPMVAEASNFQEAIEMALKNKLAPVATAQNNYKPEPVIVAPAAVTRAPQYVYRPASNSPQAAAAVVGLKWYLRPFYYYVLWPLCGALIGAAIAYLLGSLASAI